MNVKFDQVNKNYGSVSALKDINFEIETGGFVFIVGPSGAGKSTILKLILNQTLPSSGQITVGDINMSSGNKKQVEEIRRSIGVIFQDYQLIPDKSIEENIALGLDIVNYPIAQIPQKIEEVIKKVNLTHRRCMYPSQLSSGELQRAALARALAIEPKIILADEPTGNLDVENSWNLVKLLKDINENNNTTIIMTTHNMDIVESLDKRVLVIKNGELTSPENKINVDEKPVVKKSKKKLKHKN
jgi:cell division transport system ATP-binding protein